MAPDRALPRSRRLLLVFAATVFLPAAALAVLAYGQVDRERRALRAERESELTRATARIRADLLAALSAMREAEETRPWYHYNPVYYDPEAIGEGTNFLRSPLADEPANPLVASYFQIDPLGCVTSPAEAPAAQTASLEPTRWRLAVEEELLPRIPQSRGGLPAGAKGAYPDEQVAAQTQWVDRKGLLANANSAEAVQQFLAGDAADAGAGAGASEDAGEPVAVVTSRLRFERVESGDLLAWRYADVPQASAEVGAPPPVDRFVQGLRVDLDALRSDVFPAIAARYLDGIGARAVLADGGYDGAGDLPPLPGFSIVVTDEDPGRVDRLAGRLSRIVLLSAGLLLVLISGGLLFTLRAVREELRLARRRSEFTAAVTHELRTPLTGIKMYADLLREGWVRDEETRREYVGFMAAETDRLTRLVNRVLDFARSEHRTAPARPVDLAGPVREVERDFGPRLLEDGFEPVVRIETERPALADEDAVKQILLNLLDNARKYAADAKDRRIEIRIHEDGEGRIALSVADHGPGVPEPERERVFEDFHRGADDRTQAGGGAGIGLALVRRLAAGLSARADVTETPGGGATFRVAFRAAP